MTFDLQPSLRGELVEIRALRQDDEDALFDVASDPLIWAQHPVQDRYKRKVFVQFFRESLNSGGALAILDRRDDRLIGSSRLHGYNEQASEIEIGWTFLARSRWGGTYNLEVKRLMIGERGIPLREFVTEAVKEKLAGKAKTAEKPWVKHMGKLKHLYRETERINHLIEEDFEKIDVEMRR